MAKYSPGLRFVEWPDPDRIAWAASFAKGDRFRRGPAAHWASSTRREVEKAVRRWLGYVARFEPAALTEHPVDRLTGDRLEGYVANLAETVKSVGRHTYVAHLLLAMKVMYPGAQLEILKRVVAQLKTESQPRPKAWVITPHLTALGRKLIKEATK